MNWKTISRWTVGILLLAGGSVALAQQPMNQSVSGGRDVTILVTPVTPNERTRDIARKLQPGDFLITEDKQKQQILSARKAGEAPPIVEVLIQDDLASHVSNEIQCIKDFIRQLPDGSRVLTAYLSAGSLRVAQDFTTDRGRAAESLRILTSSPMSSPYSPYIQVSEALRRFDGQPEGRRMMLLISDGLDLSSGLRNASPFMSLYLDQAVTAAQQRGVAVFSFYAPSAGQLRWSRLAVNYGQGSLNRLSDETGGEAFFAGIDFVTFDPYFKELNELLAQQWLITYRSVSTSKGFRRIEVSTDYDVHLHHPAGYRVREEAQAKK